MGKLTLYLLEIIHPSRPSNQIIHAGKVITIAPIDVKKGSTVITPDGLAEVITIIPDWTTHKPDKVDVRLYKGYVKRYYYLSLQQYVIFHRPTQQFIKLSPNNYRYIYVENQPVEYRVTNRLYAQLTEDTKEVYEYAKTLNKQRGGSRFLKVLTKFNLEIKRKDK